MHVEKEAWPLAGLRGATGVLARSDGRAGQMRPNMQLCVPRQMGVGVGIVAVRAWIVTSVPGL